MKLDGRRRSGELGHGGCKIQVQGNLDEGAHWAHGGKGRLEGLHFKGGWELRYKAGR